MQRDHRTGDLRVNPRQSQHSTNYCGSQITQRAMEGGKKLKESDFYEEKGAEDGYIAYQNGAEGLPDPANPHKISDSAHDQHEHYRTIILAATETCTP